MQHPESGELATCVFHLDIKLHYFLCPYDCEVELALSPPEGSERRALNAHTEPVTTVTAQPSL